MRNRVLGTGVTIDAPGFAQVDRRVGHHGMLGDQIGHGGIRQPACDRVGWLLGLLGMAGEAPLIVSVEDGLRRAELRRRLEVMRMMALRTTEFIAMVGKVYGALEFFLYPREVVRFIRSGGSTFPWMTFHASEDLLAEVWKNVEAFDVAFLASELAVIGGSLSHCVDRDLLSLAGSGMDVDPRTARMTTEALKALTLLDAHGGARRASRCRLQPEQAEREQRGFERAPSASGSGIGRAFNGSHTGRCA
jgi:hypothetical protein